MKITITVMLLEKKMIKPQGWKDCIDKSLSEL